LLTNDCSDGIDIKLTNILVHVHHESKTVLCQILTDFHNSFTGRLELICNKVIFRDPTRPQHCHYTALWYINARNQQQSETMYLCYLENGNIKRIVSVLQYCVPLWWCTVVWAVLTG